MIKISVIIPYYNDRELILEAIKSVDSYPDKGSYEIIIVNDGSSDSESLNVLSQLSSDGYQIIHQENKGLGAARNAGIQQAKGTYILPLDSDNKIMHQYIEVGMAILDQNPEVGVVYGNPKFFGAISNDRLWEPTPFNAEAIKFGNFIDACAIYRKCLWEELGGYDEKMPWMGHEDWEFWIRVTHTRYKFRWINKPLYYYRVSANSMITSVNKQKLIENFGYIVRKNPELYSLFFNKYLPVQLNILRLSSYKYTLLKFGLKVLNKLPFIILLPIHKFL